MSQRSQIFWIKFVGTSLDDQELVDHTSDPAISDLWIQSKQCTVVKLDMSWFFKAN